MNGPDRIKEFLAYAGPGGARGSVIADVCALSSAQLYPALQKLELDKELVSQNGTASGLAPRPRYYRLASYGNDEKWAP